MSSCLNHPTIEAIGRCKQCNKPFCGACRVKGPTGNFCSDECKASHEAFIRHAKALEDMKGAASGIHVFRLLKNVALLAVGAVILAVAATIMGVEIPVVSDFLRNITNN